MSDTEVGELAGNAAVEKAAQRARITAARNVPALPDLPINDTANLREGADLHPGLLGLLPLVGVWRGEGEGHDSTDGDYRFGQQITIAHDGQNFLSWEAKSWRLGGAGEFIRPDLRESGFWRISEDDTIEFLLAHATGVVELYYGKPLNQTSWELATDVVIRSESGVLIGGAKRLYGIVEGGDLAYVEERVDADGDLVPRLSAKLERFVG